MGTCASIPWFDSAASKYSPGNDGIITKNNSSEFCRNPLERRLTENVIRENFNQNIRDFYDIDDQPTLGSGLCGQVTLCVHKTTKYHFALKTLSKIGLSPEKLSRQRKEISCMAHLDHPNIVRLAEVFENDACIYLVMELCQGGHLMDRLFAQQGRYFREKIACKYVHAILTAVAYCHANNVVHRDLKLENILFETTQRDSELKLIDFGLSQCYRAGEVMQQYVGTSYYVAPEVIDGRYDAKCDVWSVGVIAYMLLSGVPPFYGPTDAQTLLSIKHGTWSFDEYLFASVSPLAKDFITQCFTKNAYWRPSAMKALKHPWFRKLCKDNIKSKKTLPSVHILRRLGTHVQRPMLARVFMSVVSHTLLPEQVLDLREQFHKFDVSHTGEITLTDLRTIMRHFQDYRKDFLLTLVRWLDVEQKGSISYHDFLAATIRRKHIAEQNMYLAFEKISTNREVICAEDIRRLLGNVSYEVHKIMQEAGLDMDAKIDYTEFKAILEGEEEGYSYLDFPDFEVLTDSERRSASF